jgi:hypothetical protein
LNRAQLNHLFTQFHQAPACYRKLLACVFDDKRWTQTLLGIKVLSKGNSKASQKMDEVVNAPGFQDRLEAAVNHPESKEALIVLPLPGRIKVMVHMNFGMACLPQRKFPNLLDDLLPLSLAASTARGIPQRSGCQKLQ